LADENAVCLDQRHRQGASLLFFQLETVYDLLPNREREEAVSNTGFSADIESGEEASEAVGMVFVGGGLK
jgi:hypothetical protein